LTLVWLGSAWWEAGWTHSSGRFVCFRAGCIFLGATYANSPPLERSLSLRALDQCISSYKKWEDATILASTADNPTALAARAERVKAEDERAFISLGWHSRTRQSSMSWWYEEHTQFAARWVRLPLWPLALLSFLATAALHSGTRFCCRARIGHCPACNYDRRGIPAASVCPECGAAPAAPAQAST
jgi:hypothetical protein